MTSLNAPPETLRVQFWEFWIFGPKVSRVSQFSAENSDLGFLQLIEGDFQLTGVLMTFKSYCWHS
jgi:hypothetical protein